MPGQDSSCPGLSHLDLANGPTWKQLEILGPEATHKETNGTAEMNGK